MLLRPASDEASDNALILEINRSSTSLHSENLGVASFTTLYGENGSGKTEMLLQLCEWLTASKSLSKLGMFWENHQGLQLTCGASLKNLELSSSLPIQRDDGAAVPEFSTVFYTTSPFERVRRSRLRRRGLKDVSPRFGKDVESELAAAFSAYPYLRERVDFVGEAQVVLELKPFSIQELLTAYGGNRTASNLSSNPALKKSLHDLNRTGSPEMKFMLSYAVLDSVERLTALDTDQLIDALLEMLEDHHPWLDDLLSSNPPSIENLSEDPLLTKQLIKAGKALKVVRPLFAKVSSWRRSSSLAYLDEQVGQHIRQHESTLAHISAMGLLRFSFKQLSSGQASMMSLYCAIARAIGEFERESPQRLLLLCIDEGEMFMHPKWQRQYIFDLLQFIKAFSTAHRAHVLISTHSLIVAADTPAGRLFDLDHKQLINAFGYTPKQTLRSVFDVGDFTGEFNMQRLTELSDVLNHKQRNLKHIAKARRIADTLADAELKKHVQQRLDVLEGNPDAQA
ncbi:AAA family ATPase [Pseudomonas sp. NFXW11]|uniref:hypothetical protein n=1 Tax=Pseudomonas sp. NFXW11 TaxID=2819531 RepID=UPI003CED7145